MQEVVDVCRAAHNSAMGPAFLFWLAFTLGRHADKEGKLNRSSGTLAGITKDQSPHFPFNQAEAHDVATVYFDFWFRSQGMLLPSPINLVLAYIGLVAGTETAITILQKALEQDATGLMTSEIINELAKRDAIPLAYRILSLYCEELSAQTRADIQRLLVSWLEYELGNSERRIDLIKQALTYLA